ncbi:MAG: HAD hydrolase family protein [Thermodesulfobacteriota bacterium]
MYCRVIACDFDGTGAAHGHLAAEVAAALHRARDAGITTLLVTGRVLEDLQVALVDFSAFDAVVAENGALLWFPEREHTVQLGSSPPEHFLGRLREAGIPFHAGAVVVGTWEGHAGQALTLIRESGLDLQLVFNRSALMLLPSGIDKAVGVRRALEELKRSERNMIVFGDAENDLPLFGVAEVAVAARGSLPAVAARADEQLSRPGGEGVAHYVETLLDAGCRAPSPARRRLALGRADDGTPVSLRLGDGNVLVSGDPRSGKSWLAGLVAEHLLEQGYRLCIVDPEGDHQSLAQRPGCVLLGQHLALPKPQHLPAVLEDLQASVVLSLTALPQDAQTAYVCCALEALADARRRSGLPNWIVVDEAHYFFRDGAGTCTDVLGKTGNLLLATYRPSLLSSATHESIGAYLLRRTDVEAERYFVEALLGARGPRDRAAVDMLDDLHDNQTGLLLDTSDGPIWQTFVAEPRVSRHVHHRRKYVDGGVPPGKGFRFTVPGDVVVASARNVREFAAAIGTVPLESLRRHLAAGDFSRWSREVLGDPDLATGLAKLEQITALGASPSREEIIDHLRDRYVM